MPVVLVIEDDAGVRSVTRRFLERAGYVVVEAVDGKDGVDAFIRQRFDLVLTDLYMPGQDGIETIRRLQELDDRVPILAMSGDANTEFSPLKDAALFGACGILEKPFSPDTLIEMVERWTRPADRERKAKES